MKQVSGSTRRISLLLSALLPPLLMPAMVLPFYGLAQLLGQATPAMGETVYQVFVASYLGPWYWEGPSDPSSVVSPQLLWTLALIGMIGLSALLYSCNVWKGHARGRLVFLCVAVAAGSFGWAVLGAGFFFAAV